MWITTFKGPLVNLTEFNSENKRMLVCTDCYQHLSNIENYKKLEKGVTTNTLLWAFRVFPLGNFNCCGCGPDINKYNKLSLFKRGYIIRS